MACPRHRHSCHKCAPDGRTGSKDFLSDAMRKTVLNVAILGSTGSIGKSALEVIAASEGKLRVAALTAHGQLDLAIDQARTHQARWLVATDTVAAESQDWSALPADTELLLGEDGLRRVAMADEVDKVVAAIVGSAGLVGTWAALEAGKTVALANKETLVVAGSLAMSLADQTGATILPVDSEHSAVFQALAAGQRDELQRVILTASGGPFRDYTSEQLSEVTVQQALSHPNWSMGPKITIDSATMMNKALEIVEARWLFDLAPEQIDVVLHRQSIVHSLVEFIDGSIIAQLSPPDMKLPIQYALTYPERRRGPAPRLDLTQYQHLEFQPPDPERFPALDLGLRVARDGGSAGAVLNGANEAAVAGFLNGEMRFHEIVPICKSVLDHHQYDSQPSLEQLLEYDAWAREEVSRWVCA